MMDKESLEGCCTGLHRPRDNGYRGMLLQPWNINQRHRTLAAGNRDNGKIPQPMAHMGLLRLLEAEMSKHDADTMQIC